jgi:hypothetical protein
MTAMGKIAEKKEEFKGLLKGYDGSFIIAHRLLPYQEVLLSSPGAVVSHQHIFPDAKYIHPQATLYSFNRTNNSLKSCRECITLSS